MADLREFTPNPDLLGRTAPHRIPISTYLEIMVRSRPGAVSEVPRRAIQDDGEDEDGCFAMIECPCGGRPIARYALDKCAGCERYYVCAGSKTFVVYGKMEIPSAQGADASV